MYKYSMQDYDKDNMARAVGRSLPISYKMTIEICDFIRHKSIEYAKKVLNNVLEEKQAIPFKRFNKRGPHRTKIGPGRYPKNAAKEVIKMLETVEANAQFKGLNTSNLVIKHIKADKAAIQWHYGRQRRTKMKRTTIEVVVGEKKKEAKEAVKND